jgi:hypothetical protein
VRLVTTISTIRSNVKAGQSQERPEVIADSFVTGQGDWSIPSKHLDYGRSGSPYPLSLLPAFTSPLQATNVLSDTRTRSITSGLGRLSTRKKTKAELKYRSQLPREDELRRAKKQRRPNELRPLNERYGDRKAYGTEKKTQ